MSIKEYRVNDNVIIKDGFELSNIDEVNELNIFNIKDPSNWPVLYVMYSEDKKKIYIGQSINVIDRMKEHMTKKDKEHELKKIEYLKYFLIVYYKKSNLSAIWNLEDSMIRCAFTYEKISKDKEILNIANGHTHKYYKMSNQKNEIKAQEIWDILKEKGIVDKPFSEIEKDYMYKLSPLIELTDNQEEIKIKALNLLKKNDSILIDFIFENGIKKKRNSTKEDWCSQDEAIRLEEIGCVYTIQGYDIDYTGVIIGEELYYDDGIKVRRENYKDVGGKKGIKSDDVLLDYIKRIYRILLTRGIKGTYLYVCDSKLKEHLSKYIDAYHENKINYLIEEEKK